MSERHPLIYDEFDIEQARKAGESFGVKQEQERIIQLLQNHINKYGLDSWLDAIELIKGEQK